MGPVIPAVVGGIALAKGIHDGVKARKNAKNAQREINREIQDIENQLKIKENELLNVKKENDKIIKDLEKKMKEQKESFEKMKIENEKKLIEQKQKEEQKKIKEMQEKQKAIILCKNYLSEEFINCIINSFNEYIIEERKWIKQITKSNIENRKKEFCYLFEKLFANENIQNKITNKYIEIINKNYTNKELKKMNFMIIGASGVGKSTLINALLREKVAKEGLGGVCTTQIKKYESKNFPFLCLYDSVGAELGNNHTLEDVQNETIRLIEKQLNNSDPNQHIHCIIYCVTFNRFYEEETKIILKIRAKYDGEKLPIVIVYTMGNDNKKFLAIKERINKYLNKYGISISDDIFNSFGISYLKIYAKEDTIIVNDKPYFQKCFGLSDLISFCYHKGEKSYKIAIKNSLIQIAKKYFLNNIQYISDKIVRNKNLISFLEQKFEPNFSDFIYFIFEKISKIENYKDIKFNHLNGFNFNFTNNNAQKAKPKKYEINKINKNMKKSEYKCIFCSKKLMQSYKCCFCGSYACENCILEQFSKYEAPQCKICYGKNFESIKEDNLPINIKQKLNINNNKNINNINNNPIILKNNLNYNLKNDINQIIKIYKSEMLKIMKKNFIIFTQNQAEKIYFNLLEKFNQNSNCIKFNIQNEAMKSKDQIKKEAIEAIKRGLHEIPEDNFLKHSASLLFKDIIEVFENGMKNKIDNLQYNQEIKMFFKSFDVFDHNKQIKIGQKFKEYIKLLKEIEKKSNEKASMNK